MCIVAQEDQLLKWHCWCESSVPVTAGLCTLSLTYPYTKNLRVLCVWSEVTCPPTRKLFVQMLIKPVCSEGNCHLVPEYHTGADTESAAVNKVHACLSHHWRKMPHLSSCTLIHTIHTLTESMWIFMASEMHTVLVHFIQCKRWFHPETYSLGSADLWSSSACPLQHGNVIRAQILYNCNNHENSFNLQCSTLCMVACGVTNTYNAVWYLVWLFTNSCKCHYLSIHWHLDVNFYASWGHCQFSKSYSVNRLSSCYLTVLSYNV